MRFWKGMRQVCCELMQFEVTIPGLRTYVRGVGMSLTGRCDAAQGSEDASPCPDSEKPDKTSSPFERDDAPLRPIYIRVHRLVLVIRLLGRTLKSRFEARAGGHELKRDQIDSTVVPDRNLDSRCEFRSGFKP